MLFPIGLNQSYAQLANSVTVSGDSTTLNLTPYEQIGINCISSDALVSSATGVSGPLGTLSLTADCFDGDVHTWQAFILNENDDTILYSTTVVMASDDPDTHSITFDGLESNTNYRAILILTGSYSELFLPGDPNHEPYVRNTIVYDSAPFTTLAAIIIPDTPTAPDYTVESLTASAGTLTIPFSTIVPTVPGNTFDELTVTFSLGTGNQSLSDSFTAFTGTSATTLATPTSVLEVTSDTVVITTSLTPTVGDFLTFDYTVANTDGDSDSGVITIDFVNVVGDIMANPYSFTIFGLFLLPTPNIQISLNDLTETVLAGTTLGNIAVGDYSFTTNGTGNATGTITIFDLGNFAPLFQYTPASGFAGLETFEYTIMIGDKSASSQLHLTVPMLVCSTNMETGIDFGELDVGETSDTSRIAVSNTGNARVQIMMSGENWKSDADDSDTMNVGQTRYHLFNPSSSYNDKTPLTTTVENILNPLGENGTIFVYMQLLIELIDDTFRGATTQELTIGATCS